MIVAGQVHGGVVHGIGQALYEIAEYDSGGQLVTGTLVDYLIPSAADVPHIETHRTVTPSPTNPLGVKGIGEAGTIAASPAVVSAVCDALDVRDLDMPLQPETVWNAIQKGGAA
jgi:carbon-monoxide dehydrogenase large subunit